MKKDRFFVLPYSLHGDHIRTFMGRVVLDPLDPNRRFVPLDYETAGPETIVPGITEKPIPYKSRADVIRGATSSSLQAVLTKYFNLCLSTDTESTVALHGNEVKRYQMIQNEVKFKRLMENPKFERETQTLMAKSFRGRVYLIVGFLTTKGTQWDVGVSNSRMAAARAQVPTGTASSAGPDLDVGAETASSRSEQKTMTGEVEQEEIFAVAYDVVKPKRSVPWISSRYMAERPVLGDEKRASGSHLSLGRKDSSSSDEEMEEPHSLAKKIELELSELVEDDWTSDLLEVAPLET